MARKPSMWFPVPKFPVLGQELIENYYCPAATPMRVFLDSALVQFLLNNLLQVKQLPPLVAQTIAYQGVYVARVFSFVDTKGVEIHCISDPYNQLPIPEPTQVISIGASRMCVESVTPHHAIDSPSVYRVRVWTMLATED